jgi:NAD(P)H-nitrite reductase large subunit
LKEKKKDVIICRCEEISLQEIKEAIAEGAVTIEEVKRRTRAGMGLCQGRTCRQLIAKLINEYTGRALKDILPPTFRPPVRPVKLKAFGGEESCFHEKQR